MARKSPAPVVATVATPAPVAAATQPVAPAAVAVPGPKTGTQLLQVQAFGAPLVAAKNVLARAGSLCSAVPSTLQSVQLAAGRPCKVRVPYTLAANAAVQAALAAAGGKAPASELAKASTTDFVRYAVRRGWLVVAE